MAFAIFSVPGGVLAARIGKKNLLVLALALSALGVLVPTVVVPGFALLLASVFVLGVGTTLLQVAGNPIMRDVSEEGRFARNLSFAQFVKGIGSVGSTALVARLAVGELGWRRVFPVFLVLTVVALAAVLLLKVKETRADVPAERRQQPRPARGSRRSPSPCSGSSSTSAPRSASAPGSRRGSRAWRLRRRTEARGSSGRRSSSAA